MDKYRAPCPPILKPEIARPSLLFIVLNVLSIKPVNSLVTYVSYFMVGSTGLSKYQLEKAPSTPTIIIPYWSENCLTRGKSFTHDAKFPPYPCSKYSTG